MSSDVLNASDAITSRQSSAWHTAPCWCSHNEFRLCFRRRSFGLIRCSICGTYRIDPPPIQSDEESGRFYTPYYEQERSTEQQPKLASQKASRFWRVVEKHDPLKTVKRSAIDIGCGEGTLCWELQQAGWQRVIGVDVSKSRIARARRHFPTVTFFDRPLQIGDVAPESIDLIVMDNVIEHLFRPTAILSSLCRFLSNDGRIVIITPNMESGHFRLLGRYWTPELSPHSHIYLFTKKSLSQLISKAGLVVEAVGNFQLPSYSLKTWLGLLDRKRLRQTLWRAGQEAGAVFGKILNAGPMLFLVASKPKAGTR